MNRGMNIVSAEAFALSIICRYEQGGRWDYREAERELAPLEEQTIVQKTEVREEKNYLTKIRNFFSKTIHKMQGRKKQTEEMRKLPEAQAIEKPFIEMLHRVHEHAGLNRQEAPGRDKRQMELWMADRWKRREAGLDKKIEEREAAFREGLYSQMEHVQRTDNQRETAEEVEHYLFGGSPGRQYSLKNRMYEEFAGRQQEEVLEELIQGRARDAREISMVKERLYQQEKQMEQLYSRQRDLIREQHETVKVRTIREEVVKDLDKKLRLAYLRKGI